jgi:hypothetical protein
VIVKRRALLLTLAAAIGLPSATAIAGDGFEPPSGPRYCPTEGAKRLDTYRLEGKKLGKAKRLAKRHQCTVRVLRRDGEWLFYTLDLRQDRVNIAIDGRRVVEVFGVY